MAPFEPSVLSRCSLREIKMENVEHQNKTSKGKSVRTLKTQSIADYVIDVPRDWMLCV